jgi:hypothetical protein
MAIVLIVADGFGGKGDFIFILNAAQAIEKFLRPRGYRDDIYIVSQDLGISKIHELNRGDPFNLKKIQYKGFKFDENICIGDDKEKGIKAIATHHFRELLHNQLKIDYVIEGPVFDSLMANVLKIPQHVPWLLMPEYSIKGHKESDDLLESKFADLTNPQRLQLDIIRTGLDIDQKEQGVFVNDGLHQVFLQKTRGDFSFRQKYWDILFQRRSFKEVFSIEGGFEVYHQKHQLYLDYTQGQDWRENRGNTCKYFLHLLSLTAADSKLNQDVITIGRHIASKHNALLETKSELMEQGFNKVVLINLNVSSKEEVIFDNQESDKRVLRLLHIDVVDYEDMIALQALSEDVVAITGDQSRTEALGKLFFYEELFHKQNSNNQFLKQLDSHAENKQVSVLGKLLLREDLSPLPENKASRDSFVAMMQDKSLVAEYKKACAEIFMQQDLSKVLTDKISLLVLENKSEDYLYHSLRMAAVESNNDAFSSLLKEHKINFLKKDGNGNTLLGYLFIQHAFPIIRKALHNIEDNFQDEKGEKADLNKFIDLYIAKNHDAISVVMIKFFASCNQLSLNDTYSRYFAMSSSFLNIYNELNVHQRLMTAIERNDINKFTQLINAFSVNLQPVAGESILDILIDTGQSDFLEVLIKYIVKISTDLFFVFTSPGDSIQSPWKKIVKKNFFNKEYLSGFFQLEYLRRTSEKLINTDKFSQRHPEWAALLKLFNQIIRQDAASFPEGYKILYGLLCLLEKDLLVEKNPGNKIVLNFLTKMFPDPNNAEVSAKLREFILKDVDVDGELAGNIFLIQCFNRHNSKNLITMKSRSSSLSGSSDSESELKGSSDSQAGSNDSSSDDDLIPRLKTGGKGKPSSDDKKLGPPAKGLVVPEKSSLLGQSLFSPPGGGVITWEDFTLTSTGSSSSSSSSSSSASSSSSGPGNK